MTSLVGSALGAGGNTNPDGCVGGGVGGPLCSLIDVNELLRLCNGLDFKNGLLPPLDFCLNNPGRFSEVVVAILVFDKVFFNSLVGVPFLGDTTPALLLALISCKILFGKSLNPGNWTALMSW